MALRPKISPILLLTVAVALGAEPATAQQSTTTQAHPDLEGIWDFRTATPLQRPRALGDQKLFSDAEATAFELQTQQRRAAALRKSPSVHPPEWLDYGARVQPSLRTSLIVDPPDGRVPPLEAAARTRQEARQARLRRPAHGPEDRSPWERCLASFNGGPPINPGAYNNNLQILQTENAVVILTEMIHEARIVWLDGRPHLPPEIRSWQGDSIGHWEEDTLVVETTNFTDQTSFMGSGPSLRLVERFRRLDPATLHYAYTIDDPESFERPWSAEITMRKGGPIFEYACHEGNHGLVNMLKAARAEERRADEPQ